jgi:hypothetical protein
MSVPRASSVRKQQWRVVCPSSPASARARGAERVAQCQVEGGIAAFRGLYAQATLMESCDSRDGQARASPIAHMGGPVEGIEIRRSPAAEGNVGPGWRVPVRIR